MPDEVLGSNETELAKQKKDLTKEPENSKKRKRDALNELAVSINNVSLKEQEKENNDNEPIQFNSTEETQEETEEDNNNPEHNLSAESEGRVKIEVDDEKLKINFDKNVISTDTFERENEEKEVLEDIGVKSDIHDATVSLEEEDKIVSFRRAIFEKTFLVLWNDNYICPSLFKDLPENVEFLALTSLKRNHHVLLLQTAYFAGFHLVERIVIVNKSNEARSLPWKSFYILRRGKHLPSSEDYPKFKWSNLKLNFQKNCDVIFASDKTDSILTMFNYFEDLIPNVDGSIFNSDDLLKSLRQIPENDIETDKYEVQVNTLDLVKKILKSEDTIKQSLIDSPPLFTLLSPNEFSDDNTSKDIENIISKTKDHVENIISKVKDDDSSFFSQGSVASSAPFRKILINSSQGLAHVKKHMTLSDDEILMLKEFEKSRPSITFDVSESSFNFTPKEEVGYGENL